MYRIIDKRGNGKISRLMLLAKEHNGVLVCANPCAMREKAKGYGLVGFDIISYDEYFGGEFDNNKPCFIDEVERFVRTFGNLAGYSLSLEE